MRSKSVAALASLTFALVACGVEGSGSGMGVTDDEPMLQIVSESGFGPVEMVLNTGPRYTLLSDGSLIYHGFQTLEYPGRLVPPYMVATLDDGQVSDVVAVIEKIGLPEIEDEVDDSAMQMVADASTEVVTYWDSQGRHRLAVYALGIEEPTSGRNAAFLELINTLDGFLAQAPAEPFQPERVRIVAGPGTPDPGFEDAREWPLERTDLSDWDVLANEWRCTALEGPVPDVFEDATQATTWNHPDGSSEQVKLLVRPLHPGEADCPG